ncbi:kunitz-type serine protease inhibitor conotoxin Cal9.1d-like [Drosophila rhopaloa]|uniref:Kunitz-type serine protease inhibitor conotoxin Cal9.1d-like n=1 Tax=Drosophila rhopaloa TaxID=1041015 RepID=A0A6P4EN81_DRORH|nr:kunitz-type serine protease inhibitor conotoxin Cal9.1d-like [Drosophila rhopaloa]
MSPNFILIFLAVVTLCTIAIAYDKERCDAPPSEKGYCIAYKRMWVYKGKICQRLLYGGCYATANIFNSLEECQTACKK